MIGGVQSDVFCETSKVGFPLIDEGHAELRLDGRTFCGWVISG